MSRSHINDLRFPVGRLGSEPHTSVYGHFSVRGSDRLYTKAEAYFKAKADQVDWNYYVDKQVIPACLKILENLVIQEKDLRTGEVSLTDFM